MARRHHSHSIADDSRLSERRRSYETRSSKGGRSNLSSEERTTCSYLPPPPPNSIVNRSRRKQSSNSYLGSTDSADEELPSRRGRAHYVQHPPINPYRQDPPYRDCRDTSFSSSEVQDSRSRPTTVAVQTEPQEMINPLRVIHRAQQLAQIRRRESPVATPLSPEEEDRTLTQLVVHRILCQMLTPIERWIGCTILNRQSSNSRCQASVQVPEEISIKGLTDGVCEFTQTSARDGPFEHCLRLVRHEPIQLRPCETPLLSHSSRLDVQEALEGHDRKDVAVARPRQLQQTTAVQVPPETNADISTVREPLDLGKMSLRVEEATCQSVANKFATVNITALWVVADFSFLRQLAKCNELPGKDPSAIESQIYGADFSLEKPGGFMINYRFAFRLRCLPYGSAKSGATRKGHIGMFLDCEDLDVQETTAANPSKWSKANGYVGRSLISVALVDRNSQTSALRCPLSSDQVIARILAFQSPLLIPLFAVGKTVVEHIFGSAAKGKCFAFPKYLSVKNDKELAEFQESASCGNSLVFRVIYKALIAPMTQ